MKNIKSWFVLFFLLCVYCFVCAYSYVQAISSDLKDSVFRLHVIANSDSDEDQALKLVVRDNLLNYMNKICDSCSNKEQAMNVAMSHIEEFKRIAEDTVRNKGFSYCVNVEIGEFDFPTKNYGDVSLPSGLYDALRVKIGDANGHNWWCVMFPPLCFVDVSSGVVPDASKQILENELNEEEFALVSDDTSSSVSFKFKLLELFNDAGLITAKK